MKSSKEIKKARQIAGLTQKQMAERIGTSQSYVSQIESGARDISLSLFLEMCRKIGIEDFNSILKQTP